MNYKHHLKYFQSGDTVWIIGATLAIVGAFSFFFVWSYIAYMLSYLMIPIGLFLFFWSTSRRSNDKDIEEAVEEVCAEVKIHWEDDKKLSARRRKNIAPIVLRGYEYEEGLLLKKMKSGSLCSSRYTAAEIAILEDAVYLTSKTFSLISEECEDRTLEIPFSEIQSVDLWEEEKRLPYQKTTVRITERHWVLCYGENQRLSFPVNNDLSVEHFTEQLQILLAKSAT